MPTAFDLGSLSDLFSAFFGDDLFAAGGRGRGPDVGAEVTIELSEAAGGRHGISFQVATTCQTCHGDGLEPGTVLRPFEVRWRAAAALSRTALGEFVRTQTCAAWRG